MSTPIGQFLPIHSTFAKARSRIFVHIGIQLDARQQETEGFALLWGHIFGEGLAQEFGRPLQLSLLPEVTHLLQVLRGAQGWLHSIGHLCLTPPWRGLTHES